MTVRAGAIVNTNLAEFEQTTAAQEEAALVQQARDGALEAFSRIVARHQTGVFNYLRQRVPSRQDAEDLTQETFVRAWTNFSSYNDRWRISTWLYAIATRLAIDHMRAQKTRRKHAPHAAAPNDGTDPAQPIMAREARRSLWAVAERLLSAEERSALWLKYAEHLSSADIARALGRNTIAVRVMLFRARRVLAAALDEDSPASVQPRQVQGGVP